MSRICMGVFFGVCWGVPWCGSVILGPFGSVEKFVGREGEWALRGQFVNGTYKKISSSCICWKKLHSYCKALNLWMKHIEFDYFDNWFEFNGNFFFKSSILTEIAIVSSVNNERIFCTCLEVKMLIEGNLWRQEYLVASKRDQKWNIIS